MGKHLIRYLIILGLSIFCELVFFNRGALSSITATDQHLDLVAGEEGFESNDMEGPGKYLYVGVECSSETGEPIPVPIGIFIRDEG
ncbi:MAG: hypothetical protein IJ794_19455, partial [Lachnospiraceae bacterium]|nr:hypothetical protein [Lachnospiraceae bacterium]